MTVPPKLGTIIRETANDPGDPRIIYKKAVEEEARKLGYIDPSEYEVDWNKQKISIVDSAGNHRDSIWRVEVLIIPAGDRGKALDVSSNSTRSDYG